MAKSHADFIEAFLSIGFTNHRNIITKVKDYDQRVFYIKLCANRHLDTTSLLEYIAAKTYEHRGQLTNNFAETLPSKKYAKRAIMAFKDEYLLDFINVEQLGERDDQDVDERVIENGIVENIKKFIMMFGRGFCFIGNQHRLEVGGKEFFIDLLFYNRELSALVAIELKAGDFKPSYLGQLNFYLTALDEMEKFPHENPSIGLVLCKSANKTIAEYAVRDFQKPMGVATYKTSADMPEKLRKALPDLEDLKQLL